MSRGESLVAVYAFLVLFTVVLGAFIVSKLLPVIHGFGIADVRSVGSIRWERVSVDIVVKGVLYNQSSEEVLYTRRLTGIMLPILEGSVERIEGAGVARVGRGYIVYRAPIVSLRELGDTCRLEITLFNISSVDYAWGGETHTAIRVSSFSYAQLVCSSNATTGAASLEYPLVVTELEAATYSKLGVLNATRIFENLGCNKLEVLVRSVACSVRFRVVG